MRIAYVCADPGVPVFGDKGCSLHVQEVMRVFVERGDSVDLFAVRLGGDAPKDLRTVRVHSVLARKANGVADREKSLQEVNASFSHHLTEQGPFDLIYERHSLWSYGAAEYGTQHQCPVIVELNAPLITEQATHRELVDLGNAEQSTTRCLQAATVVACVSSEVVSYAVRHGARQESTAIVPNGVRTDRFVPRSDDRPTDHPFTIGFVGALRPWHAVKDLLSAFLQFRNTDSRLVIVGDGPQREAILDQVAAFPKQISKDIDIVGHVSPEEIPRWLQRFDVGVAPYASESECYFSPLKVYEYLSAGLPVIAARVGQLPIVIKEGQTGLLYTPGDPASLADALERLRDNPELTRSMALAARVEVMAHHSWQQRIDKLLDEVAVRYRAGTANTELRFSSAGAM